MALCSATPKVFLAALTVVFWAAAAGLLFIGAWVYKEYHHYEEIAKATYTLVPATILLAAGIFFFILGLVGCVGACKEQKCLLATYFTILLVILVGVISAAVLGYIFRADIDTKIYNNMVDVFKKYDSNNTVIVDEIDFMQQKLQCCGINNYTDWQHELPWSHTIHNTSYPASCCQDKVCHSTANTTTLYERGCYTLLKNQFLGHLSVTAGVSATFAAILIVGMICSCILICRKQGDSPYIGLTSPEHMRV